jgi:DNA-binding transcriptional LysR family regulator
VAVLRNGFGRSAGMLGSTEGPYNVSVYFILKTIAIKKLDVRIHFMQIESFKVFCDVVRHRSFSRAALENDLTQSAVSQIVSQFEKRLNVQLIDRSTRPLRPTALGQEYYEGCRTILGQFGELEARICQGPTELVAQVRVAAIYSVGLGDMHEHEARFSAAHPNFRIQVEYLHPNQVYDEVDKGSSDFGLVSFPRRYRKLAVLPWREEEMVLVCAPTHPLAQLAKVRPAQLDGEKYVGFERGLSIRREVDRFLREHNVAVDVVMEFDNIENIKKAIEIASCVALLPEPSIRKEVQLGSLVGVPLSGSRLVRPLGVIHRKAPRLSQAASSFIDHLLQRGAKTPVMPHSSQPFMPGAGLAGNGAAALSQRTTPAGHNGSASH